MPDSYLKDLNAVQAEVGDPQLVSNSLGPFMTLASTTSLAQPLGLGSGGGAAEAAAAAAAAADVAADLDAEEAAERAAGRELAAEYGGQAPSSPIGQTAGSPLPPETPPDRAFPARGPAAAGMFADLAGLPVQVFHPSVEVAQPM